MRRARRLVRPLVTLLILIAILTVPFVWQDHKPLPPGVSYAGMEHPTSTVEFLADVTYLDDQGERRVQQRIFDEVIAIIESARRFVLLDMFLYNSFQGQAPAPVRRLSEELTDALLERQRAIPGIDIVVITDPINTVYGGLQSEQFERLRSAGIRVVTTRLEVLRDSNPVYSLFWRLLVRPFGNGDGEALPNPFGEGRVSVRSYLDLLNFKANHRKTIVADRGDSLVGLVTSANPHDGSSAHSNIGLQFDGAAVLDLIETENAVLAFSGAPPLELNHSVAPQDSDVTVQILTEGRIKQAVLASMARTEAGDALSLAMFYLSDRDVVRALKRAADRGVDVRVLLDPNRDAFGREKNGIPARPVAHELHAAGVPVRWCDTHGEQCHMKMLLVDYGDGSSTLIAGSANFTRRNLEDFNLETNVAVRGPRGAAALADARSFYEALWHNEPGFRFSTDYETFADEVLWKRLLYQFMERSGISTF